LKVAQQFVSKHFSSYQNENKVILPLYEKLDKKRQFLYWVNSIQSAKFDKNLSLVKKHILSYAQKRIVIEYEQNFSLQKCTKIELKLLSHKEMIVRVQKGNERAIRSLIKTHFKEAVLSNFLFKSDIRIMLTQKSKEKLEQLLKMSTLSSTPISFIYNVEAFSTLFTPKSANNKDYFSDEALKLKRSYMILHSISSDSMQTIKKRYRTLRKKYHPDRVYTQDSEVIDGSKSAFMFWLILSLSISIVVIIVVILILRGINNQLVYTIESIANATMQLRGTSAEIASASMSVADGASAQASSVEEVNATMHETSGSNDRNITGSKEANSLAIEANGAVDVGDTHISTQVKLISKVVP
jgi:hypothetical protein